MARKFHNHRLQPNPLLREEDTQNTEQNRTLLKTIHLRPLTGHKTAMKKYPLMNLYIVATVHSLMNDTNMIDSCQAHMPV